MTLIVTAILLKSNATYLKFRRVESFTCINAVNKMETEKTVLSTKHYVVKSVSLIKIK